jgi:hypothetical protein
MTSRHVEDIGFALRGDRSLTKFAIGTSCGMAQDLTKIVRLSAGRKASLLEISSILGVLDG